MPDVHRNLTLAIAALTELEEHRTGNREAIQGMRVFQASMLSLLLHTQKKALQDSNMTCILHADLCRA